ncbi:fibronectin type III domain-containing protein [Telluribacter sp. SYSU D00476]|uniref:fibronectin type III domain-containing protein n=1 Tax=Telluribacter sp. SYSU D00476 TaxID=2811430 RepID=UPI001FF69CCA|nr:hypothetical protein [Telluribacter sp. SYSU D00476]
MKLITNILIFLGLALGLLQPVSAQKSETFPRQLVTLPSPRGNYLLVSPMIPTAEDTLQLRNTAYFVIERAVISAKSINKSLQKEEPKNPKPAPANGTGPELKYREVEKLRRAASRSDLRQYVSDEYIANMKSVLGQSTDEQLINFIQNHYNPFDYKLLALGIELQSILGQVFLDTEVEQNDICYYRVYQVDKKNRRTPWGEAFTIAGVENQALKQAKFALDKVISNDSLVAFRWTCANNALAKKSNGPLTGGNILTNAVMRQEATTHISDPATLRANLYLFVNNSWQKVSALMPLQNTTGDSLVLYWQKKCRPEEVVRAYVQPYDLVYNEGVESDTATGVAVSKNSVSLIYAAFAKDTTDAIRLSWKKLPPKPYYTGVEISKEVAENQYEVIATVSPQDTVYVDYEVRPGITVAYRVRALFIPIDGLQQEFPAEVAGTCTNFSRPLPVRNLKATHQGPHVKLEWEGVASPSLFGYYVYRGTSPRNLSLVSQTIRGTMYVDSSDALSGRSTYYYSVLTMNLTQDTSDLVPPVAIQPRRAIETTYPRTLEVRLINGKAWLSWNDVREYDTILDAYVVQRQDNPQSDYKTLHNTPLRQASLVDSTLTEGSTYTYRVAAITAQGDTTQFSEATVLAVPFPTVQPVFNFYVRNTSQGVEVSWPNAVLEKRTHYVIYRRRAEEVNFTRIGEVSSQIDTFLDTNTSAKTKYVYTVTALEAPGRRESKPVKSKAITKE